MRTVPMGSPEEQRRVLDEIAADPNAYLAETRRLRQARCQHRNTSFSRLLCACGWMHTDCLDCGATLDGPCAD